MSKFAKRKLNLIFVCGGGTGGHVDAMRAIANQINLNSPLTEIIFVGSRRGLEGVKDYRCHLLSVRALRQGNIVYKVQSLFILLIGLLQALFIYFKRCPDAVIGVGGYASGPMTFIASIFGTPTYIVEQNLIPGLTNQILSFLSKEMFVTYEETKPLNIRLKPKTVGHIVSASHIKASADKKSDINSNWMQILCLGGSQGAICINKVILETLPLIRKYRNKIHFIHQIGNNESVSNVEKIYNANEFSATVYNYINNIDEKYKTADLVICRAGAGTLAELLTYTLPAIAIPYPHSSDLHQLKQAKHLEAKGLLLCIEQEDLTPYSLATKIENLVDRPAISAAIKNNMRKNRNIYGAQSISLHVLNMHEVPHGKT